MFENNNKTFKCNLTKKNKKNKKKQKKQKKTKKQKKQKNMIFFVVITTNM